MRKLLILLLTFWGTMLTAQTVDITAYDQNIALRDTFTKTTAYTASQLAAYPSISEIYQIPAFDLYSQYWDVNHLRSTKLTIPFVNDRLMLILVQSSNNPFEIPCVFDEIHLKYGSTKKGDFHPGVDLKVEPQTLVKSCFDGVVRMAKPYGNYGLVVVVRHYNGLESVYAHLDKICVKPGQQVQAGNVIGQTGNSGNTSDYILHFELRFLNEYIDPEYVIDFNNETLHKNTVVLTPENFNITKLDEVGTDNRTIVNKPQPVETKVETKVSPVKEIIPVKENVQEESSSSDEPVFHIIQKGETLYRISINYHTTVDRILELNNIQNADVIAEGRKIRVK